MSSFLPGGIEGRRTRSGANSDFIVAADPGHSQGEYKPGTVSGESDSDVSGAVDDEDGDENIQHPKKKARHNPTEGDARKTPCLSCTHKMIEKGPGHACLDQASPSAIKCYDCARQRRACPELPAAAVGLGGRLQAAAIRILRNQPKVHDWDELAAQLKQVLLQPTAPQVGGAPQTGCTTQARVTPQAGGTTQAAQASMAPMAPMATVALQAGGAPAQTTLAMPPAGNLDNQTQLLQTIQFQSQQLARVLQFQDFGNKLSKEALKAQQDQTKLLQQALLVQERGFADMAASISQLQDTSRQIQMASSQQTNELRHMHDAIRGANGRHDPNMPNLG